MRRFATLLVLALSGCGAILGLDERELDPSFDAGSTDGSLIDAPMGGDSASSAKVDCPSYCDLVGRRCDFTKPPKLYQDPTFCAAACARFPTSDSASPNANTLSCRIAQLHKLGDNDTVEGATYCPGAGPGGSAPDGEGASAACGSNCESYCAIRAAVCLPDQIEPDCLRKCQALPSAETYDVAEFSNGRDNIQCRLAHLIAAAKYLDENNLDERKSHCAHSGIKSNNPCNVPKRPVDCNDVCKITTAACTGGASVYETEQQCRNFCSKLSNLTAAEAMNEAAKVTAELTKVATARCMREGAYAALQEGPASCKQAGPVPDRCGAGRCDGYCTLAESACRTQFMMKYPGGPTECIQQCSAMPGGRASDVFTYSPTQTYEGNSLQCRLKFLTRAVTGEVAECPAALGLAQPCN